MSIIGFVLFSVVSLLSRVKVERTSFIVLITFFMCIVMSLFQGIAFSGEIDIPRLAGLIIGILILVLTFNEFMRENSAKLIAAFLSVHITFFYAQFLAWYLLGVELDFLGLVGLESRNFGGSFEVLGISLMRSSGLFSEPGTYSCFMAPPIAFLARYVASGGRRTAYIFWFSLLSLPLSFSSFGLVFSFMILLFNSGSLLKRIVLFVPLVIFVLPYFIWRFFERTKVGLDTGLEFRFEYITSALQSFTVLDLFFWGRGGASVNSFDFYGAGADNDSGLIFFIMYNFGGLSALLFICCMVYLVLSKQHDRFSCLILAIMFLSKINFFAFVFPFYLGLAFMPCYKNFKYVTESDKLKTAKLGRDSKVY